MGKEYYLGLDIGTDSVGWAVCDTDYKIPKFKGNAMWGIRLFEKSNSAEERRGFRSSRRRTQRKRERLKLLEMLFDEEISKIDPAFLSSFVKAIYILRINLQKFLIAYFLMRIIPIRIFTEIIRQFII